MSSTQKWQDQQPVSPTTHNSSYNTWRRSSAVQTAQLSDCRTMGLQNSGSESVIPNVALRSAERNRRALPSERTRHLGHPYVLPTLMICLRLVVRGHMGHSVQADFRGAFVRAGFDGFTHRHRLPKSQFRATSGLLDRSVDRDRSTYFFLASEIGSSQSRTQQSASLRRGVCIHLATFHFLDWLPGSLPPVLPCVTMSPCPYLHQPSPNSRVPVLYTFKPAR